MVNLYCEQALNEQDATEAKLNVTLCSDKEDDTKHNGNYCNDFFEYVHWFKVN